MILSVAAFLMLIGFGTWIVGVVFEYAGIAVIGATVVVGVGAMFTATGLSYRDGSTTQNEFETREVVVNETTNETRNETVIVSSDTVAKYRDVEMPTRLPLGVLVMLLGGVGALRGIDIST